MADFSGALNVFSSRLAEVQASEGEVQTDEQAIAAAYERFSWLVPFVQALDVEVKKSKTDNRVFVVRPSFEPKDRKVSGRIFFEAPGHGQAVVNFVIQGSRMQLSGPLVQAGANSFFAPEGRDGGTNLIALAAAEYFGRT